MPCVMTANVYRCKYNLDLFLLDLHEDGSILSDPLLTCGIEPVYL